MWKNNLQMLKQQTFGTCSEFQWPQGFTL